MRHARIRICGMLILLVLYCHILFAQNNPELQLNERNKLKYSSKVLKNCQHAGYYFVMVQLTAFPNKRQLNDFYDFDIEILQYKGNLHYLAAIPIHIDESILQYLGVRSIKETPLQTKISKEIQANNIPPHAKYADKVDVALILNRPFSAEEWLLVETYFEIELLQKINKKGTIQTIRMPESQLKNLACHPNVQWMEPVEPSIEKLNHENIQIQRTNVLQSTILGGRALTGESVVIGVGDGGELGDHIDLNCRVINHAEGTYSSYGAHGDHVSGTIASAGNLNPRSKGMAPKSELIIQKTTNIIYNTEEYIENYGMVVTNNSYGVGADCDSNGSYNYSSINLDMQLRENPELIHLFAAGNSGNDTCNDYPQGFKTVLRYYGSAKNVLTVGAVDDNGKIANLSSRGPVADGRIKPEICGPGVNVESTGRNFDYFEISGTSMSTPSVAGTIALLYERFRQLHDGANPKGALMKAISCNTADDVGNFGPDYIYGFGLANAHRAVKAIEKQQYSEANIEQSETKTHSITVPEGVEQLKVMLYWHDKEASVEAEQMLVNDLDLKVVTPANVSFYPWVLNHEPDYVSEVAARGFDHLNNIEQVTINTPVAGNYTVQVKGFEIPMGAQDYVLTYDFVYPQVELTYPFGKESFEPNTTEILQWNAASTNISSFLLEYSNDGGISWELIADNISGSTRQFAWHVPSTTTEYGRIRIRKEEDLYFSYNQANFSILAIPENLWVESPCDAKIELTWDSLDYAIAYEVFLLDCAEMVSLGTTDTPSFSLEDNLIEDSKYWFSIRAIATDGSYSQRTIADFCYPTMYIECIEEEPVINEEDNTENPMIITSVQNPVKESESDFIHDEIEEEEQEEDIEVFNDLKIYPNPFQNNLRVTLQSTLFEIDYLDMNDLLGHSVLPFIDITKIKDSDYEIQLNDRLPKGVYYLTVVKGEQREYFPVVKL